LKLPDLNREFILQTNASTQSLGGCLLQMHGGVKHPVFYACKKLIPREQNYSVGEREVKKFHRYLYEQHFTLESDRRPLEYLQTSHSQNPRIMKWSLALQPCRYTVKGPKTWLQITSVVQTEMITAHVVQCDMWSQSIYINCKYVVLLLHYSLYDTVDDSDKWWYDVTLKVSCMRCKILFENNIYYTVFQKKVHPRTFMITLWNRNQFK